MPTPATQHSVGHNEFMDREMGRLVRLAFDRWGVAAADSWAASYHAERERPEKVLLVLGGLLFPQREATT
jgi:hypothetical protein